MEKVPAYYPSILKPVSVYVLTISMIGGFRMFEESYVLWQNNSPGNIYSHLSVIYISRGLHTTKWGTYRNRNCPLLVILLVSLVSLKLSGSFKGEG